MGLKTVQWLCVGAAGGGSDLMGTHGLNFRFPGMSWRVAQSAIVSRLVLNEQPPIIAHPPGGGVPPT